MDRLLGRQHNLYFDLSGVPNPNIAESPRLLYCFVIERTLKECFNDCGSLEPLRTEKTPFNTGHSSKYMTFDIEKISPQDWKVGKPKAAKWFGNGGWETTLHMRKEIHRPKHPKDTPTENDQEMKKLRDKMALLLARQSQGRFKTAPDGSDTATS